jgi:predicted dehydrogenase
MISKRLRIGIAGFGAVGKIRFDVLIQNKELEIVSVSDQNIESRLDLQPNIRKYKDFEVMISHEKLDVLFIALPNYLAAKATILALNKKMHVFCEKPPARNPLEFKKVVEVSKNNPDLKLMYGFNHRYHPSVKKAMAIISSRELGDILNMRGEYGKSAIIKFDQNEWRAKREFAGGGILLDQGIHLLDLMRYFGEDFSLVNSVVKNSYWNYEVEDNAYALMQTNNGIVALFHSSATLWRHSFRLEIGLTKGSILLSGILSSTKSYGNETIKLTKANPEKSGEPEETTYAFLEDTSWSEETNMFIESVQNGIQIESGNLEEARKTLDLVYRIYKSDGDWNKKFFIEKDF